MTAINIMDPKFIPSVIPDRFYPITRNAVVKQDAKEYYVGIYGCPIPAENGPFFGHELLIVVKATEIVDGKEGQSSYRVFGHLQCAWAFRDSLIGMDTFDEHVTNVERWSIMHHDYVPLLKVKTYSPKEMESLVPRTFAEVGIGN